MSAACQYWQWRSGCEGAIRRNCKDEKLNAKAQSSKDAKKEEKMQLNR